MTDDGSDDERWARAQAMLAGAHDEQAEQSYQQRRQRARRLSMAIIGIGLIMVAVGVVLLIHAHPHRSMHRVPAWAEVLGGVLSLLGCAVELGALVWLRRNRSLHGPAPTTVLSRPQRRLIARQVAGRESVSETSLPLAIDLARRQQRLFQFLLMAIVGGALVATGGAFDVGGTVARVIAAVVGVYLIAYLGAATFGLHRVNRFLRQNQPAD